MSTDHLLKIFEINFTNFAIFFYQVLKLNGSALTYVLNCDDTQANYLPPLTKSPNWSQDNYDGSKHLRYFDRILPGIYATF